MKVVVDNVLTIYDVDFDTRTFCKEHLCFDNPEYATVNRGYGRKASSRGVAKYISLDVYNPVLQTVTAPRAFISKLIELHFNKHEKYKDIEILFSYKKHKDIDFSWNAAVNLYDFQKEAVNDMLKQNGFLIAPAGSGKTIMSMKYIAEAKKPTIFIVHTNDLLEQAINRAKHLLLNAGDIGIINALNKSYIHKKLIVASIHSLVNNNELIEYINNHIGTVVIDEAHHIPAESFSNVVSKLNTQYMIALTATPERKDGLQFIAYAAVGNIVHRVERQQLYDSGFLIKPELKFIYTDFVDKRTAKVSEDNSVNAGGEDIDFNTILSELFRCNNRAKLIAETIISEIKQGNYQIVLSESVDYAYKVKSIVDRMIEEKHLRGVVTEIVHGGLSKHSWIVTSKTEGERLVREGYAEDLKYDMQYKRWKVKVANYTEDEYNRKNITGKKRKLILERAARREVHILFATKIAQEGLDIPHLNIGHCITPKKGDTVVRKGNTTTKAQDGAAVEQEIGRIMRIDYKNPNKKAIWYDYVDYGSGILKNQYNTRRRVYERLGLIVPRKTGSRMDNVEEFLKRNDIFGRNM